MAGLQQTLAPGNNEEFCHWSDALLQLFRGLTNPTSRKILERFILYTKFHDSEVDRFTLEEFIHQVVNIDFRTADVDVDVDNDVSYAMLFNSFSVWVTKNQDDATFHQELHQLDQHFKLSDM